jgi:hypothetical protein
MEAKGLSVEVLKFHNANVNKETKQQHSTMGPPSKSLWGAMAKDKHSDSSSKVSSVLAKDRFSRLRTKLKMNQMLGGSFSRSKTGSEIVPRGMKTMENTYRMGPDQSSTFNTDKTKYIIMSTFESYLKDRQYDPKTFPRLCKTLADLLKERVKSTGPKRFKIITNVSILENKEQCAVCASRCIWDTDNDNFSTATYNGKDFSAIGTVFALYYE